MDISLYAQITGISVDASNEFRITAQLARVQSMLENMLGYSLDPSIASENQYIEIGKSKTDCLYTTDNLDPADSVIFAYRMFDYNKNDKYLSIDPCTTVHAVKLVRNGVTLKTIENYMVNYKGSFMIKYLEQIKTWCDEVYGCKDAQLAVDAVWMGAEVDYNEALLPMDLLNIWADMVTYYTDTKREVKSETLGTHSYTKTEAKDPSQDDYVKRVLRKYAGPNGTLSRTITV